jgi:hypothetical protein
MNFKDCINEGKLVETGDKDIDKVKEMLKLVKHKYEFWNLVKNNSKEYPTLFIEGYYEIIKELVVAILLLDGWKSSNHDCLFQYLIEKKKDLDIDFEFLSDLRRTRNRINYDGITVSYGIWRRCELKVDLIVKDLIQYVEDKLI